MRSAFEAYEFAFGGAVCKPTKPGNGRLSERSIVRHT